MFEDRLFGQASSGHPGVDESLALPDRVRARCDGRDRFVGPVSEEVQLARFKLFQLGAHRGACLVAEKQDALERQAEPLARVDSVELVL